MSDRIHADRDPWIILAKFAEAVDECIPLGRRGHRVGIALAYAKKVLRERKEEGGENSPPSWLGPPDEPKTVK